MDTGEDAPYCTPAVGLSRLIVSPSNLIAMATPLDAFRQHHRSLLERLDAAAEQLKSDPGGAVALELDRMLTVELLDHAHGEEAVLYAAVEPLLAVAGRATATMRIDHEYIERAVQQISQTIRSLGCAPDKQEQLAGRLRQQLDALRTILALHIEKEERVYLPLLEEHLSVEQQQMLLERVHSHPRPQPPAAGERELDVRAIPPAQRHPLIFATFDQLPNGGWFVLVNDHDPKPLYYQFQFERSGQLDWEYLESGPEVWRVRITKRSEG